MRLVLLASLLPLAACGQAGGDAPAGTPVAAHGAGPTRSYPVTGFTAVDLTSVDDVEVHTGGPFAVRAEGDPKVLDRLVVARDGDTLRIGRASGSWSTGGGAKLFVTVPRLTAAAVSGTGELRIDRVAGGDFKADASGTGAIRVGALAVGRASVSVSGAGDVSLAGHAQMLAADVSGTGDIDASALTATGGEVTVSGTGDVRAAVSGPATVSLSGTGNVDLGPRARCQVQKSGTGDVTCGG